MRKIIDNRSILIEEIRKQYLETYFDDDKRDINSNTMMNLGLNMYVKDIKLLKKELFNVLNSSKLNKNIVLHPQQIDILNLLLSGENMLISAPTSFGKTYIALEYIKRKQLKNIVFVVPTLALMNELSKKFKNDFSDKYNIITNSFEKIEENNIFILVPERVDNNLLEKINDIDLLVFDEIYKLKRADSQKKDSDKRIIALNKGYFDMVNRSKQILLLGPFIKKLNFERTKLKDEITEYYTDFAPVLLKTKYIWQNKDYFLKNNLKKDNSKLIYFKTPMSIYKFCNNNKFGDEKISNSLTRWCDKYISADWLPSYMLKRGIGIHHGSIPNFMRKYIEYLYNKKQIVNMLCTSTLLEGINTPTNELIIYDSETLTPFQTNNLIGRVGRLDTYQIGYIYYFDRKLDNYILGNEKYEEITIIAEDNQIMKLEELIYLEKNIENLTDEQKQKISELKLKLELYNKDIADLKKTDGFNFEELIKFIDIIPELFNLLKAHKYNCDSTDSEDKKRQTTSRGNIIELFMKVIPALAWQIGEINKDSNSRIKQSVCVNYLLNIQPLDIYAKINNQINKQSTKLTKNSLNIFIDYLFYLSFDYIKHNLSKIVRYCNFIFDETYIKENLNEENKQLINLLNTEILKRFELFNSDNNKTIKILIDLGIPYADAKIIDQLIVKKNLTEENISTGKIYKLLEENQEKIYKSLKIEELTKDIIRMIVER